MQKEWSATERAESTSPRVLSSHVCRPLNPILTPDARDLSRVFIALFSTFSCTLHFFARGLKRFTSCHLRGPRAITLPDRLRRFSLTLTLHSPQNCFSRALCCSRAALCSESHLWSACFLNLRSLIPLRKTDECNDSGTLIGSERCRKGNFSVLHF